MLNFEEEMKAVKAGYVVMSLEEYNNLRDQIAEANMKAYNAEQLANRRIAEHVAEVDFTMRSLIRVSKKSYGDRAIEFDFNTPAVHALAVDVMQYTFSAEELEGYEIKPADDMFLSTELLARRKPDIINE